MKTRTQLAALAFAAAAVLFAAPAAFAASATALVSATVLGPAGEETASGAVTLSRVAAASDIELARAGRSDTSALARFRVSGGSNATFAVSLPETVVVKGHGSNLEGSHLQVTGFRAANSGRLGSDGTTTIAVGAQVQVEAGQAAGVYTGNFPVTVAYN